VANSPSTGDNPIPPRRPYDGRAGSDSVRSDCPPLKHLARLFYELPRNPILGNSEDKEAWKAPQRFDPGLKLNAQYSCWSSPVIR
jgi:hypothetical protein